MHPLFQRSWLVLAVAIALPTAGCTGVLSLVNRSTERFVHWQRERQEYRTIEQQARLQNRELEQRDRIVQREASALSQEAAALTENACLERQRDALRDHIQESVQSKVAFDVNQQLRVGELQVDAVKLKKLLDEREKLATERQKLIDDLNKQAEDRYRAQLNDYLGDKMELNLEEPTCERRQAREETCCCQPNQPLCHHCRKKRQGCGGMPDLPRSPLRQNLEAPLLATEIPLMLPVTLEFGMKNPTIEDTRIRRVPVRDITREPVRDGCTNRAPSCPQADQPPQPGTGATGGVGPPPAPPQPVADAGEGRSAETGAVR